MKIQDGCSFSCSFCVIPLVRGATRSRSAGAVLAEIARRVEQGHREIVLTGVNLGCFRDREAGYALPRLIRAAGSIPGVERLRLSSIEVNHLGRDLVAALRETPTASLHLHVPLQSGDDGVLRAMRRRYSSAQYLAKLDPLRDFNLTADVIVGFPGEDDAAFARTLDVIREAGITRVHAFPYSPRPGTATAAADTVPIAVKKERSARLRALSDELSRRRWASRVGSTDRVLVDRPGRGYGADYTPWLVDGEVGRLLPHAPSESPRRESLPSPPESCLFCRLVAEGDHVHAADGFVAIRDINPIAETHILVLPERHVDTFRDIDAFPDEEAGGMLRFVAETAKAAGLDDYKVLVNVGEGGGQTVFHLHWHVLGGRFDTGKLARALELETA